MMDQFVLLIQCDQFGVILLSQDIWHSPRLVLNNKCQTGSDSQKANCSTEENEEILGKGLHFFGLVQVSISGFLGPVVWAGLLF